MNVLSPELRRGKLCHRLHIKCNACSVARIRCSKDLPCSRCERLKIKCEPSYRDNEVAAQDMFVAVIGRDTWYAQAKLLIALQANACGSRLRLPRNELLELRSQVPEYSQRITTTPRVGVIADLPHELKMFVGDNSRFKVEWLIASRYHVMMSDGYAEDVIDDATIRAISSAKSIPPKLIDTCNLSNREIAFSMWNNSLIYPKTGVKYTGSGVCKSDCKVTYITVRMMSDMINPEYVVTVTTVGSTRIQTL